VRQLRRGARSDGAPAATAADRGRGARTAAEARLRPSAEVHVDVLDLGVGDELLDALLAADPGVLEASVGGAGEVHLRVVDPDVAGLDIAGKAVGRGEVGRIYAGRQAERDAVRDRERLVIVLERHRREDRPEDLLLGEP